MRLPRALAGATRRKAGEPKWIKKKSIDGRSHTDFTIPMPSKIVVKHPGNGSHGEQRA
jgi:hypothetical protein